VAKVDSKAANRTIPASMKSANSFGIIDTDFVATQAKALRDFFELGSAEQRSAIDAPPIMVH
jgi:hypothetical protein